MKRIAVMTSGGDAPGMNAAVSAVVRKAISMGMEVYGINSGYKGMAAGEIFPLTLKDVEGKAGMSGTFLYTARYPEFKTLAGQQAGIKQLRKFGIEGVIVIGGDGSYQGAMRLTEHGFPAVGLPGTIDNDIAGTDFTIGFDSAAATALEEIDRIHATASAFQRTFIVEAMGRDAGDIALWAGIAASVDRIIIPEESFDFEEIARDIKAGYRQGKTHYIIVLAEGVMPGKEFAEALKAAGDKSDLRVSVLGHIQRGGVPTLRDRVIAARMGAHAVELLQAGLGGLAVGIHNEKLVENKIFGKREEGALFDVDENGGIIVNFPHQADLNLYQLNIELNKHG